MPQDPTDARETLALRRRALTVLSVCVLMNLVARGYGETFTVFILPMSQELAWSRAQLTGIFSVNLIVYGVAAPVIGALFDRIGGRLTYALGLACYATGFILAANAAQLWQAYLGIGILGGLGITALGMVPASGLISRWFEGRLSTAMGLAYAGLGLGVILVVPTAQWLIDLFGWRQAYWTMAISLIAALPVVALLPWRRLDAGNPAFYEPGSAGRAGGLSMLGGVVREGAFWGLFAVYFFTTLGVYLITIQSVVYLVETGFSPIVAATAYGVVGMLTIPGMIGTGWLADRYGRRLMVSVSYAFTMIGIALLWVMPQAAGLPLLGAFVFFFGLSQGARGPIVSTLATTLFRRGTGVVYGAITFALGMGGALGAWLAGILYDTTGGYRAGFAVSLVALAIGLAQFWLIPALGQGRRRGQGRVLETMPSD